MKEKQNSKRKSLILMAIGVLTLLIVVAGATYAFFQAQMGEGQAFEINAQTASNDSLVFLMEDIDVTDPRDGDSKKIVDNHNKDANPNTEIVIEANQQNFVQGGSSIGDGVKATATLTANNTTNSAEADYYVYVNITNNELKYSSYKKAGAEQPLVFKTEEEKTLEKIKDYTPVPELIMIVKKDGEAYNKTIGNLESQTITINGEQVEGYDITEKSGIIEIAKSTLTVTASEEEVSGLQSKSEEWNIEIILVNLQTNQELNTGKHVTGEVIIQKEEMIAAKLYANAEEDTLIYHNGTMIAPSQISNPEGTEIIGGYQVTTNHQDEFEILFSNYPLDTSKTRLIKYYCNDGGEGEYIEKYVGSSCSSSKYYTLAYENEQQPQPHYNTYKQALQKAINDGYAEPTFIDANDESYRFSGKSDKVHNYVCLDNNKVTDELQECANDDLYRIIGLFKNNGKYEMKLIKADYTTSEMLGGEADEGKTSAYYGKYSYDMSTYQNGGMDFNNIASYYWTGSDNSKNLWKDSALNTYNLNQKFKDYLEKKLGVTEEKESPIADHDWITAGNGWTNIVEVAAKEAYKNEIESPNRDPYNRLEIGTDIDDKYSAKIGLMYVSDYGYATSKENWQTKISDWSHHQDYRLNNVKDNNWMYMGLYEWTITRRTDSDSFTAFDVCPDGFMDYGSIYNFYVHFNLAVRPCFYLKSTTKIVSGDGTSTNPYRLSW